MAVNNDDATKHIFSRCLLNCLQVPLWYVILWTLYSVIVSLGSRYKLCKILVCRIILLILREAVRESIRFSRYKT